MLPTPGPALNSQRGPTATGTRCSRKHMKLWVQCTVDTRYSGFQWNNSTGEEGSAGDVRGGGVSKDVGGSGFDINWWTTQSRETSSASRCTEGRFRCRYDRLLRPRAGRRPLDIAGGSSDHGRSRSLRHPFREWRAQRMLFWTLCRCCKHDIISELGLRSVTIIEYSMIQQVEVRPVSNPRGKHRESKR